MKIDKNDTDVKWVCICLLIMCLLGALAEIYFNRDTSKQSGAIPVEQAKHPVSNRFSVGDIDNTDVNLIIDTKTGCEYFKSGDGQNTKVTFVRNSCRVEITDSDK